MLEENASLGWRKRIICLEKMRQLVEKLNQMVENSIIWLQKMNDLWLNKYNHMTHNTSG